jgi:signal transduction histidine kinase
MFMETEKRSQTLKLLKGGQETGKVGICPAAHGPGCGQPGAPAPEARFSRSWDATRRLVQQLEAQQMEMEMQHAEKRLARDQVDAALDNYRDLYDFAPVGYLTLDRDGSILAVNHTGAALLGIDGFMLLGRRFGQLVADSARFAFGEFLGKVFSSAATEGCEVPLLKGGRLPCFVQVEAVAAASGRECRAVIIDISARRRLDDDFEIMHAELANRAAKLEHANLELEAFNYTVSHDLCTPLTGIGGFSEVLVRITRGQLDEQAKGCLQGILENTRRMKRLITSLLDFSRVTLVEINRETVDLSEMAQAVASELKLAEPESRVTFRVAEGITGKGDAGLCRIVLENLLGNAWKYTANRTDTVIEFGMTELGGKPVYFVSENGPGFDMAQAGKLFIPFQRIPGIEAGGHGIGLATVKRIVKRHGGRVWAESSPGNGATFFYTLE